VKRGNPTTESYTYDAVGNRLSALNSSPWTYDDRNELLSLPGTTFTYDPNGNVATKVDSSGNWSYVFDVEDRLIQVFKNSAEVARYAYDPLGRRLEKVASAVTRSYVYEGEDILRETAGTNVALYLQGPGIDEPLASEDGAGVRTYLHADGLGSIVKTTDASGAAVSTIKYNAFGVLETGSPSPFGFTARESDSESGLYYYRARYYDAKLGRFVSEDPIRFLGGNNFYTYVENNPARFRDPYGLEVWPEHVPGTGKSPIQIWWEARNRTVNRTAQDFARDPSNRFNHCMLNCELQGTNNVGRAMSWVSDYVVVTGWPLPGVTREDDPKDRQANACGRWGGQSGRNCQQVCGSLDWTK
jgi:RHS repeat-associated protein